jgi:[acyl-carrier-protein] S-malonyltransferase
MSAVRSGAPVIAFPGQGIKHDAVVDALARHRGDLLVERFLDRFGLATPAGIDVRDTRMSQPAVYACGLAAVAAAFGPDHRAPMTLGHSLGEVTALAHAGVIDPGDGFELVCARGQICHAAQAERCGAMLAVMGAGGSAAIEWIRRQASAQTGGVLEVAGLNGRRQTVLSGDDRAVEAAVALAASLELVVEVLPIGGAFHSPLLAPSLEPWRAAVEAVPFSAPATVVVSTIDASPHTDPAELRELLVRALMLPVRWLDAIIRVRESGHAQAWDAGPGEMLKKLSRRDHIIDYVDLAPGPVSGLTGVVAP